MTTSELIRKCIEGDPRAQRILYQRYAPLAKGVILRYVVYENEAEELLSEVMYRVLTRLDMLEDENKLESWIRSIAVNSALMHLRRKKQLPKVISIDELSEVERQRLWGKSHTPSDTTLLLSLINRLPEGYRLIFNLYVIDGYRHREIAEMLGISIHTSKSQLIKARRRLQKMWEEEITRHKRQKP